MEESSAPRSTDGATADDASVADEYVTVELPVESIQSVLVPDDENVKIDSNDRPTDVQNDASLDKVSAEVVAKASTAEPSVEAITEASLEAASTEVIADASDDTVSAEVIAEALAEALSTETFAEASYDTASVEVTEESSTEAVSAEVITEASTAEAPDEALKEADAPTFMEEAPAAILTEQSDSQRDAALADDPPNVQNDAIAEDASTKVIAEVSSLGAPAEMIVDEADADEEEGFPASQDPPQEAPSVAQPIICDTPEPPSSSPVPPSEMVDPVSAVAATEPAAEAAAATAPPESGLDLGRRPSIEAANEEISITDFAAVDLQSTPPEAARGPWPPDESPSNDERKSSMTEDFFEVAAARIAELSVDAEEEKPSYAQDTPTPRLVVIAENIDSVDDNNGGRSDSGGESDDGGECVVCEQEGGGAEDVEAPPTDNSRTDAADSGVNEDSSSSTTATTPDDSSSVFSPKRQPAASLSSALLDRKQSSLQASTKSSTSSVVKSQPLLTVRCTNAAIDGDNIRFALHSTRDSTEQEFVVDRSFEDFEWLHECMTTTNDFPGLIFPPLPKKPNAETLIAESERRNRRSSSVGRAPSTTSCDGLPSIAMTCQRRVPPDCRAFETYLNLLLTHPVIADDSTLVKFVTEPQAVPRVRLKKGFLFKLSFAIDTSFNSSRDSYPDSDNYFQRERDWVLEYLPRLAQAATDCNKLIDSEMKISKAYDHLSTTLSLLIAAPNGDKRIAFYNDMLTKFRRSADALAEINESVCFKDEDSIFSTLNVFTKYMEASRDMLHKRIGLLVDYNEAVNKVTSAKPTKKKQAESTMVSAEKAFADCTVVAKKELRHFRVVRIAAMKKALVAVATARRDEAQRARDTLTDIHAAVKAL